MHIRGLWEEKGSSHSRLVDGLIIPDEFTIVGQSVNYKGKGHREHVIPCKMIVEKCHEMICDNADDDSIAEFIKKHVKIVLISIDEKNELDRKSGHNLKQSMPDNWTWAESTDIYARLTKAGIRWLPYSVCPTGIRPAYCRSQPPERTTSHPEYRK